MKKVEKIMKEYKGGKLHSGSKHGPKVKSKKQAIAIGLSEARKAGEKVPEKKANVYLSKLAAEVNVKMNLKKVKHPALHTAMGAVGGGLLGGFGGSLPGQLANHSGSAAIGAGLGTAVGAVAGGVSTHRKIKRYNTFVDKLDKAQAHQKKANVYIDKLAAKNKVIEDEEKAMKSAPKADNKYLTRMKLRGC